MRTFLLTALALLAFAANSILCRFALGSGSIDAASFTSIRLASGAVALLLIPSATGRTHARWNPISAAMLFAYAIGFSFAYRQLTAGTGALLLFGAVQITMLTIAIAGGEHPPVVEWLGLLLAIGGLVYLVLPGLHAPPFLGSALMVAAGIAWGIYTLRGRGATNPVGETAHNFTLAALPALAVSVLAHLGASISTKGVILAACSGVITSGIGYVIWYAALPGLTAARAALVQLAVPLIAAAAGIAFLGESLTPRLVWAGVFILGGICLAVLARQKSRS
ncbi:MAG TPA: DMT family transporter [Candidatus Eisenbacteria bacterium]|nr:DMT family transporter [Candidatus Eisenbacteria bacterium]